MIREQQERNYDGGEGGGNKGMNEDREE